MKNEKKHFFKWFIGIIAFIGGILAVIFTGKKSIGNDGYRNSEGIDSEQQRERDLIESERDRIEQERDLIESERNRTKQERELNNRDNELLQELERRQQE